MTLQNKYFLTKHQKCDTIMFVVTNYKRIGSFIKLNVFINKIYKYLYKKELYPSDVLGNGYIHQ